jgi:hypothetical protein
MSFPSSELKSKPSKKPAEAGITTPKTELVSHPYENLKSNMVHILTTVLGNIYLSRSSPIVYRVP